MASAPAAGAAVFSVLCSVIFIDLLQQPVPVAHGSLHDAVPLQVRAALTLWRQCMERDSDARAHLLVALLSTVRLLPEANRAVLQAEIDSALISEEQ